MSQVVSIVKWLFQKYPSIFRGEIKVTRYFSTRSESEPKYLTVKSLLLSIQSYIIKNVPSKIKSALNYKL